MLYVPKVIAQKARDGAKDGNGRSVSSDFSKRGKEALGVLEAGYLCRQAVICS